MTDTALQVTTPSGMELLAELARKTDDPQVAVAVAKSIVELQIQMERFNWEREERQAKINFDDALHACQEKIGRIAPNRTRENNIGWADYAQLDRVIRPIYTEAGFSISFSEAEEIRDGKVMIRAVLSRSGVTREYLQSVTPSGNTKMNAADMEASGQSRAQRYLLLKIFNVAIGIDEDERKPFEDDDPLLLKIAEAHDVKELNRLSLEAIKEVHGDTEAVQKIGRAKNKRLAELKGESNA